MSSKREDGYLDDIPEADDDEAGPSRSLSPLSGKEKSKTSTPIPATRRVPPPAPSPAPEVEMVSANEQEEDEDEELTEELSEEESPGMSNQLDTIVGPLTLSGSVDDESEDEYVPPPPVSSKGKPRASRVAKESDDESLSPASPPPSKARTARAPAKAAGRAPKASLPPPVIDIADDEPEEDADDDDSVRIIPNKAARNKVVEGLGPNAEYVPGPGEVEVVKKKKRSVKSCYAGGRLHWLTFKVVRSQGTGEEAGSNRGPDRQNCGAASERTGEGEDGEEISERPRAECRLRGATLCG
jgi:hypothetical protein